MPRDSAANSGVDTDADADTPLDDGIGARDEAGSEVDGDADGDTATVAGESFKPPSFLDALKSIARPSGGGARGTRIRAQPASGTAAEARRVNYVDKRERLIGLFLGAFQAVVGIAIYFEYRRFVAHPSTKKPKLSVTQAHKDTLNYHHLAPEFLVINIILGLAIVGGTLSKRRALVGFTILLGGLGLNATGGGILGLLYLGVGLWLVFRSLRRNPRTAAARAGAAEAGRPGTSAGAKTASRGGAGSRGTSGARKSAPPVRKAPAPSSRYTPPRPSRPSPQPTMRPVPGTEPEKESKIMSWLRR